MRVSKTVLFKVLSVALLVIMTTSLTVSTVNAVKPTALIDDDVPDTVIIYTEIYNKELVTLSKRIYKDLRSAYSDVQIRYVDSLPYFIRSITHTRGINIYVLPGSLSGVKFGGYSCNWQLFGEILLLNNESYHIVAFGNTKEIFPTFNGSTNVFVEGSEVIDAEFVYLYALWKTADILNESSSVSKLKASRDIRIMALQYYQDNSQDLYSRVISPKNPLGESKRFNILEKLDKEAYIRFVGPKTSDNRTLTYDEINSPIKFIATPKNNSGIFYSAADNDSFVPIMKVPEKSGLPGPIASIFDKLLGLLFDWLKDKLGASEFSIGLNISYIKDILDFVNNTVLKIKKWISDNLAGLLIAAGSLAAIGSVITYDVIKQSGKEAEFWAMVEKLALKGAKALSDFINNLLAKLTSMLKYEGKYSIGLGSFSAFTLTFTLAIYPKVQVLKKGFVDYINRTIFNPANVTGSAVDDLILAFDELLHPDFVVFMPVFKASLDMKAIASDKNSFFKYLLDALGLKLEFSGGGSFEIALFKVAGSLDDISFFEVLGWAFRFSIKITKSFTLLDFISGGATSTGPMALIQKFLGLDKITIDIFFKIALEIIKRAGLDGEPDKSTLTLDITIGAALNIQILIVDFYGAVEVTLRFFQDFAAGTPLQIFLILHLYIKVKINLLILDAKAKWDWYPLGKNGLRLTPNPGTQDYKENAQGQDDDKDGLSNDFENKRADLDSKKYDTDGDQLSDLQELSVTFTKPDVIDTDGDGLTDGEEYFKYKTDPLKVDTDRDGISDGEEVNIYGTNPLVIDTDEDGLSDFFEINYSYPLVNVTPSVTVIYIGGKAYNNHTDPLNPDTDNDGLLDGDEWTFGKRYGDPSLFNSDMAVGPLIIFNGGYTHPLDNDTDDDSYEQLSNGTLSPRHQYLYDMRDGVEVNGQWVMFINATTGDPELRYVVTNPCIPDSDGDTAPGALFLVSDGYELSLMPPSDPNDADMDDDGLIDGLEGMNIENGNHTNYNNPDTDNDGLNDLLDTLLPTDPRDPDSDDDMLLDGEEYLIYGTSPYVNDTDYDGLTDGEELLLYYTNPLAIDSDLDGLNDGEEILIYDTDPMSSDTDNDGLSDFYEIFISKTNPIDSDSDNDTLSDGDELTIYFTDPLNWDTDGDSLTQPLQNGSMTLNWGDNVEIAYGTDPTISDTDGDGLTDAQEIYLSMGSSTFDPIPVNPLNNDTDGDGLLDGREVALQNESFITYPYFALSIVFPFGTSPVVNDTDHDGLNDYVEIAVYGSSPTDNDTDKDTLPDYDEVYIHGTSPANNDTDGDGLTDDVETTNATLYMGTYSATGQHFDLAYYHPTYQTSANDSDTDDDLLPDGLEITRGTDPLNPDSDGDGITDGYEFDTDNDGLTDGEELYIYETYYVPGGGIDNPDSDGDGLSDGDEVHIYNTSCVNNDTDGDGFSDGAEVEMGTDPTTPTNTTEIGEEINRVPEVDLTFWYILAAGTFVLGLILLPLITFLTQILRKRGFELPFKPKNSPGNLVSKATSNEGKSAVRRRKTSSRKNSKEGVKQ